MFGMAAETRAFFNQFLMNLRLGTLALLLKSLSALFGCLFSGPQPPTANGL
jgi:hypothetical protein